MEPFKVYADPIWITEAKKLLGLHEGTNENPNPAVLKIFRECGHPEIENDHKTPWCAAFVGSMMHRAKVPVPVEVDTLWATDWENFGIELDEPIYGCIGVKSRGNPVPGVHPSGHVTFIVGETPTTYLCLGGNQGDRVCIEAIAKDDFYTFRWPSTVPIPRPAHPMLVSVPALKHNESEE